MQPGTPPRAIAGGGTLRMIVRPQVGGAQVRVRLSNVYGSAPLAVDAVSAARAGGPARVAEAGSTVERAGAVNGSTGGMTERAGAAGGAAGAGSTRETVAGRVTERGAVAAAAAVDPETERPVTFAGRAATVIPPGEEAVSDPVPVAASGSLAVTITVPALPPVISEHPVALQTSWLAPPGVPPELGAPLTSWLLLSGVDVLAPRPVHAIVAVGDSITDGVGTDAGHRRPLDRRTGGPARGHGQRRNDGGAQRRDLAQRAAGRRRRRAAAAGPFRRRRRADARRHRRRAQHRHQRHRGRARRGRDRGGPDAVRGRGQGGGQAGVPHDDHAVRRGRSRHTARPSPRGTR